MMPSLALRSRTLLGLLLVAALIAAAGLSPATAAGGATKTDLSITGAQKTPIWLSVYRPAGATAADPVPVILHSHGWGGSRESSDGAFATELARGYGVVSFDQRGFGDSGGKANVQDPELEGRDVKAIIDYIASLPWVEKDRDSRGRILRNDPVLFAMGGSYGGGFQTIGALTEIRDQGRTRFNALAPEITWYDLPQSLAPAGVVRTAWNTLLYAAGAADIVEYVHPAFAWGASTGQWPDGTNPAVHNLQKEFFSHSPAAFVRKGVRLNIPMLVSQGASDNLFNLNQGLHNFGRTLTRGARSQSLFMGFNGGHALPNVAPAGYAAGGDACSGKGGFSALRLRFFDAVRRGANPAALQPAAYNLTSADGESCIRTDTVSDMKRFAVGHDANVTTGAATTTGAGAPQHLEVADGPLTVAGIPRLRATVTSAGVDQRVFFALSVGSNPLDAKVVQNNMMPLRELLPIVRTDRVIELAGVAVDVKKGEKLFLTISPVSDMSFGHGSNRTPGVVGLENMRLELPVVR